MSRGRARRKSNKKTVTIAVLAACLLLAAIGGTIAWLTARDSLINQFTVGDFTDPSTDPDDPTNPLDPEEGKLQGHLYEKDWVEDSKLIPGGTVAKDPNVGIGKDSEDAYVYLYVRNTAENNMLYFKLNENWKAVEGSANAVTLSEGDTGHVDGASYYTGGLFVYTGGGVDAAKLSVGDNATAWTGELFSEVYVDKDAKTSDLTDGENNPCKIEVTALLYQATDGEGGELADEAARWANEQAGELAKGIQSEDSDEGLSAP